MHIIIMIIKSIGYRATTSIKFILRRVLALKLCFLKAERKMPQKGCFVLEFLNRPRPLDFSGHTFQAVQQLASYDSQMN